MSDRYRRFLRQRYGIILRYVGLIALIGGWVLLLPLLALFAYPQEWPLAWGFWLPGLLMAVGYGVWRRSRPPTMEALTRREGIVVVLLGWLVVIGLSTLPYQLLHQLTPTQACFEATSGWTTTGLSVVDVTRTPHLLLLLLLRSLTQLLGGAGFAIIAVSTISSTAGAGVTSAEGRGEQLVPNVRHSAKLVLAIYSSYVALGIVGLRLAGMGWFDAINHSFAAVSTGGFSTRPDSIGSWHQPAIELVVLGLMIAGSVNFLTVYLLLQGRFRSLWRNSELRLQLGLGLMGTLLLWTAVSALYSPLSRSLRVALFETVTALSTTGFATVSYEPWGSDGWWLLICLMAIGGGTGSTAGGIKLYRVMLLLKHLAWEINRRFLPLRTFSEPSLWQGHRRRFLTLDDMSEASLYLVIYLLALVAGTGLLTAYGYPLQASLFEFVSSLATAAGRSPPVAESIWG